MERMRLFPTLSSIVFISLILALLLSLNGNLILSQSKSVLTDGTYNPIAQLDKPINQLIAAMCEI